MTESLDAKLARYSPLSGSATEYTLATVAAQYYVTAGTDGNLWLVTLDDKIGVFDLDTETSAVFGGIPPGSVPHFIVDGEDGFMDVARQNEEVTPEPGGRNRTRLGPGRLARINIATKAI